MKDARTHETDTAAFTENERPTRPFAAVKTSTSRWRAVASAAIQRGFGRKSEGDFDLGPAADGETGDPPVDEASLDIHVEEQEPRGEAPVETSVEPHVDLAGSGRTVPAPIDRPTRDLGPRGTVRIVPRRDLGPTGTVLIRRVSTPGWTPPQRMGGGAVMKVLTLAVACTLLTVAFYRGSRPAMQSVAPLVPQVVESPPVSTASPSSDPEPAPATELAPTATTAAAAPAAHAPPRRPAASKPPRVKSSAVF